MMMMMMMMIMNDKLFQLRMLRLGEQGRSYCAETSLHGLKYITEDGRHIVERVIWIILFTSAMCLMVNFMIPGRGLEVRAGPKLFTVCHDIGQARAINNSSFINNAGLVYSSQFIYRIYRTTQPSFLSINHLHYIYYMRNFDN